MLQRDEVVMAVMMVLMVEMMVMMIPMKYSAMAVAMAMISPSGREFPPETILSAGELFSLWCFLPRSGSEILLCASP
jgi:hypothetical protein